MAAPTGSCRVEPLSAPLPALLVLYLLVGAARACNAPAPPWKAAWGGSAMLAAPPCHPHSTIQLNWLGASTRWRRDFLAERDCPSAMKLKPNFGPVEPGLGLNEYCRFVEELADQFPAAEARSGDRWSDRHHPKPAAGLVGAYNCTMGQSGARFVHPALPPDTFPASRRQPLAPGAAAVPATAHPGWLCALRVPSHAALQSSLNTLSLGKPSAGAGWARHSMPLSRSLQQPRAMPPPPQFWAAAGSCGRRAISGPTAMKWAIGPWAWAGPARWLR